MVQSLQGKMHVVITSLINVAFIRTSLKEKKWFLPYPLLFSLFAGLALVLDSGVVTTILGSANAIQSLYKLLLSKAGRRIAKRATIVCVQWLLNSFEWGLLLQVNIYHGAYKINRSWMGVNCIDRSRIQAYVYSHFLLTNGVYKPS